MPLVPTKEQRAENRGLSRGYNWAIDHVLNYLNTVDTAVYSDPLELRKDLYKHVSEMRYPYETS